MRSAEQQVTIRSAAHPLPGCLTPVGGARYAGIPRDPGRPLSCRKAMTAVPAVAGSSGRPGPGPVPRLSTSPRRDYPPGRLSASRAGGQTSVQPVQTSGVRPARRGVPGHVVGAEPDHGHIRMAHLACPRVRGTRTGPRWSPGLVGNCRRHPQWLRAAGLRPPSPVGSHCRRRDLVRGHGALCPAGPPDRPARSAARGSRGYLDGVCHGLSTTVATINGQ